MILQALWNEYADRVITGLCVGLGAAVVILFVKAVIQDIKDRQEECKRLARRELRHRLRDAR